MIGNIGFADNFDFIFFDDFVNNYVRASRTAMERMTRSATCKPVAISYDLCDDAEFSGREVCDISEEDFDRILVL